MFYCDSSDFSSNDNGDQYMAARQRAALEAVFNYYKARPSRRHDLPCIAVCKEAQWHAIDHAADVMPFTNRIGRSAVLDEVMKHCAACLLALQPSSCSDTHLQMPFPLEEAKQLCVIYSPYVSCCQSPRTDCSASLTAPHCLLQIDAMFYGHEHVSAFPL